MTRDKPPISQKKIKKYLRNIAMLNLVILFLQN